PAVPGRTTCSGRAQRPSEIQVPLDQVVFLEPAQALLDLTGSHRADALHSLELPQRRARQRLESVELADETLDHRRRKTRHMRQGAVAARAYRRVQRADPAGIPEPFGDSLRLEQQLVTERFEPLEGALLLEDVVTRVVVGDNSAELLGEQCRE